VALLAIARAAALTPRSQKLKTFAERIAWKRAMARANREGNGL
jgi:hypothetical protein